ncbi:MAG: F420-0--gamma-glutamyl ligase [Clostridiales bacterium]|jgi:F420-0:gamma-glutamyl ligase|nr:F420-0--gamma-glutamyl ligase [Clostridiales bacterium]
MRVIGTQAMGIRTPIIKQGDDLVDIVVSSVLKATIEENLTLRDKDVVGVTEAVVARAQGNYATVDQIAGATRRLVNGGTVGLVFPIMSRNRFSLLLKGIAKGADNIVLQLSYPSDEVGNPLISLDALDEKGINPYTDSFTEEQWRALFGSVQHPFTGIDYIEYYSGLHNNISIVFSNDCRHILQYTDKVIACDIHSRKRTKRVLNKAGASLVLGLDDILVEPYEGSGFNKQYGLLGSNKATDDTVKLFPRDCDIFVKQVEERLRSATGKKIEVMVYGDGAFKDPVGGIWELADPIVSPAYTEGLQGTPNELKLKYLADNQFAKLAGKALESAVKQQIREKGESSVGEEISEGTTPRRLTDLLGSLCDLVSGSGDKGTPVVLIQGYFDNYAM